MNLEQYKKETKRIQDAMIRTNLLIWGYLLLASVPFIYFLENAEHDLSVLILFIIAIVIGNIIILKSNGYFD